MKLYSWLEIVIYGEKNNSFLLIMPDLTDVFFLSKPEIRPIFIQYVYVKKACWNLKNLPNTHEFLGS